MTIQQSARKVIPRVDIMHARADVIRLTIEQLTEELPGWELLELGVLKFVREEDAQCLSEEPNLSAG